MSRLHIPGLIDLLRADTSAEIQALGDDRRLDRAYKPVGPLVNRLVAGRIRRILAVDGKPLSAVAPHGPSRPTADQASLEARLDTIAAAIATDANGLRALSGFVRGKGRSDDVGPLTQAVVGRLFEPAYQADAESWRAAIVLDLAPRTFNPFRLIVWALTGRVAKARALLAAKVGSDPAGTHATGIAVHNLVRGFAHMRELWADPHKRHLLSPEAAAAQCLFVPEQVVRQPTESGDSVAGPFGATTLVLLRLGNAHAKAPSVETAFMAQSWSRCPATAWVPALLRGVWAHARESSDGE